jgi:probable F420-dependent oxidoreductase
MSVALGKFGAWFSPQFDDQARVAYAAEAERLGYTTVWLGFGAKAVGELDLVEAVLASTERVTVATAIINMWTNDAETVARSYHRLEATYPGRLLLGVGVGHPESIQTYQKPHAKMVEYLDLLDAGGVPKDARVLAALGPRSLALAAERALGAHPYLVVPEHTRRAREALGPDRVLAPEHKVVVDSDPERARAVGRAFVENPYLGLTNYVSNLHRLGFSEDDTRPPGSDRLIDALALHGEPGVIAAGLTEHLDAGADHVGIQVLTPEASNPMAGYRALAEVLL